MVIDRREGLALALQAPRPMVFSNGVFDLLHAGHVECLESARRHGRSLVVGVNSDVSARRLGKGPGRPINDEGARVRVVAALAAVWAVVVFDEPTPLALMQQLRPDVYVKGGDYAVEQLAEAELIRGWGGRTVIVPRVLGLSSSLLMRRIEAAAAPAAPGLMELWR